MDAEKIRTNGWQLILDEMTTIRHHASRIARRKSDTDDLVNELSILVFESLPTWDESKLSLKNWISVVASRRLPRINFQQHGPTRVEGLSGKRYELREECNPDTEEIDNADSLDLIRIALEELSDDEAKILQLRSRDVSRTNCAQILGRSITYVGYTEKRSIEKIRDATGLNEHNLLARA